MLVISMMRIAKRLCPSLLLIVFAVQPFAFRAEAQKKQDTQLRTLQGHVFSRQDQPLEKAVVYLKNSKTLAIKTYISEQDGSYHFPALSPNVDYEVYAEHNGARSDTKTLSAFDSRKLVNITLKIK